MEGLTKSLPGLRRHLALAISLGLLALPAAAIPPEQAKRIYDRLAGVPPSVSVLAQTQSMSALQVADLAMTNKSFYNATLKNWITPWTNRDSDKFAPLNDYTATVIGVIRDDKDYRTILFDNILYVGAITGPVTAPYSPSNNTNYQQLEANDIDLGDTNNLVPTTQVGLAPAATAGVLTSRAAARAFFIDGTNRAMFRFTLKNHLCNDMEQVQDITRPSDRIRRDVPRSPGGDSRIFMNTCIGCHSGMDPMAQAFAYYDFAYPAAGSEDAGQIVYTPGVVQNKYHINENHFIEGYNTPNDHWDNYWRAGPNTAIFGWSNTHVTATAEAHTIDGIYGDAGAKSMAEELANSDAFATCSVKKVFKAVCLRDPTETDRAQLLNGIGGFGEMLTDFKSGHKLKKTFAQAAVYCSGN